jgi:hypothetical protein
MLFILVVPHVADCIPSVIHARFKHLDFDVSNNLARSIVPAQIVVPFLGGSLPGGFNEQQAVFHSTAHSLGRRVGSLVNPGRCNSAD